jgi:Fibronectin type III domain/Putative peptidoglycan binding domain
MRTRTAPVKGLVALFFSLAMVVSFAGPAAALPTADFTYDVATPAVDQPVTFTFHGTCDEPPCHIQWRWFTRTRLGTTMPTMPGDDSVVTYAFPDVDVYSVVAKITNSTPTHGSVSVTQAVKVVASAPRNVAATSATHNQVTVAWDVPEHTGGAPVTGYRVTVADGNPASVALVSGADQTATLPNVKAGTFDVTVTAAVNSIGESAPGTASVTVADDVPPVVVPPVVVAPVIVPPASPPVGVPAVVTAAPAVPGTPLAAAVKPGGVTTVSWTAPAAINGAPVSRYLVTVDGRLIVVKHATTSLTVKGLRAGPARILVRAVSRYGVSKAAATKIVVPKAVARAPKPILKLGMHGVAVKRLQIALKMGHHSGAFGRSTRAAVLDFQKAHGLARTGVTNDRMRYLLAV